RGADAGRARARAETMLSRGRAAAEGGRRVERAWLATAEAHAVRAEGMAEPSLFAAAAEAWDQIEWPYEAALARWREAEAHLAAGDRQAATVAAGLALDTARRLGAGWPRGEAEGLCNRHRLP